MEWWRSLGLAVGMALILRAAPVSAEPAAGDKAAADTLFDQARKLMAEHKYAEACPKFAASHKLDPGLGTLLNLALCFKENGQTASAWSTYREAAAIARASNQTDREQLARAEAAALEPKLTNLLIAVPGSITDPAFEVRKNGALVPRELWNVPSPVDPGEYRIAAGTPGKAGSEQRIVASGAGKTLRVDVSEAGAVPASAPAPATAPNPAPAPAQHSPGSGRRVLGIALAGAGAAGIGVGTVFGLKMKSSDDEARSICIDPTLACTVDDVVRHADLTDEAKSERTIFFAGVGLGSAALVTGAILFLTAPKPVKQESSLQAHASLGPNLAALEVRGTW